MLHDVKPTERSRLVLPVLALLLACSAGLLVFALFAVQEHEEQSVRSECIARVAAVHRVRAARARRMADPAPQPDEVDRLAALVCDPRPDVRWAAIASMTDRRDPSMARHLAPAVASEDAATRSDAICALSRLGGPGARQLLARADAHPRTTGAQRLEIRDALAALRRNVGPAPGLPYADPQPPTDAERLRGR